MGMNNHPDRIWAWYDTEYEVVSGGLKKFPFDLASEYIRADLVEPEIAFIREVREADKIAIRNAALREAAAVAQRVSDVLGEGMRNAKDEKEKRDWQSRLFVAVNINHAILALIGEKK
jgi:hypothetical protein